MAMTAGAAAEFAPAMMAGETGASAGAWGLAGESTAEQLAAYQAAMAGGEMGAGAGAGAWGLEDIPASIVEGSSGGGLPESYWSQLADSGVPINDAGGGMLEGNMPFEPSLEIPNYTPSPEGGFPETAWSPSSSPTGLERFINDPTGYGSRLAGNALTGGSNMSSAGGSSFMDSLGLGDLGLSNSDLLRIGSSLYGTRLNQQQTGNNQRYSAEELQRQREFQREMGLIDIVDPRSSSLYTTDPVTGRHTRTTTLNPADQAALDARRGITAENLAFGANVKLPDSVDFGALAAQYRTPSFGGTYVMPTFWK